MNGMDLVDARLAIDSRNVAIAFGVLAGAAALLVAGAASVEQSLPFIAAAFVFVLVARKEQRRFDAIMARGVAAALAEGEQPGMAEAA